MLLLRYLIHPLGKWGLTKFDASALWVRDRRRLINALDITPEYLRTKEGDAGIRLPRMCLILILNLT